MQWEDAEKVLNAAMPEDAVALIERSSRVSATSIESSFSITLSEARSEFKIKVFEVFDHSLEECVNAVLDFLANARLNPELLLAVPF